MRMLLGLAIVMCSGCIVVPRPYGYRAPARVVVRDCPHGYHWDGYGCRHNGNGRPAQPPPPPPQNPQTHGAVPVN